jgi:hypothetical protein
LKEAFGAAEIYCNYPQAATGKELKAPEGQASKTEEPRVLQLGKN